MLRHARADAYMDRGTKMTLSRKTTPPTVGVKYSVPYWLCPAPRISMLIIALHLMRVLFDSLAGPRLPSTLRFGEGRANNHMGQNSLRLRSPGPLSFRTPKATQSTDIAQIHSDCVEQRKAKKPRSNNVFSKCMSLQGSRDADETHPYCPPNSVLPSMQTKHTPTARPTTSCPRSSLAPPQARRNPLAICALPHSPATAVSARAARRKSTGPPATKRGKRHSVARRDARS